ncbi:AAA family ATPase [Methylopila sp. 73B]|uniref:ATP-dependent DNA helicase n=1 Tax=Methylopila sp. 73B TaxID=1120792 RepID=UPI0003642F1C|nr:AAA family ATPase [Methylopila sp. 73B]
MILSPQQEIAAADFTRWFRSPSSPVYRLFGYAGTGKTTLAKQLAESVSYSTRYAAFTGKAALMLKRRGCTDASTIHSLIYRPVEKRDGSVEYELNTNGPLRDATLLVIDECSMVDEDLARDLLSFNVPILALGDPAQLPPVSGAGYFTDAEPDTMLTEIHRQLAGNPIIRMSIDIREGRRLALGQYGQSRVIRRADLTEEDVLQADQVLVGRNVTRQQINTKFRGLLGRPSAPTTGDKLVCLKNKRDRGLLNGGLWRVDRAMHDVSGVHRMKVTSEDEAAAADIVVPNEFFTGEEAKLDWRARKRIDEFTYGYALTVHKSQGSQWDDVVVFDESSFFREHATAHLYTALTRAAKRVTIVQ